MSAKNLLYAFGASLMLITIALAIAHVYPLEADAVIAASRPPHDPRPGVQAVRRSSVSAERADDVELAPYDGTVAPGNSRLTSHKPGTSVRQSVAAAGGNQPAAVNTHDSADYGWLNPIAATLANALPFGGRGPTASTPPVTPVTATLSEIPSANQFQVRDVLYSDRADMACLPGAREFTLDDVRGLYVCVVWSGLAGTYAQQVTFESPDGHVYQTVTSAFATAQGTATEPTLNFNGRAYPVQAAGWGADGRVLVTAMLPVAGTFITQYNLVGQWAVRVTLNGQAVAKDTFELLPRN